MRFYFFIYDKIFTPLLYLLFKIVSLFNVKVKKGISGRKNLINDIESIRTNLDEKHKDRKLILFHAVSMGEYEQARPLAKMIKEKHPEYRTVVSFFSPTGYEFCKKSQGIDFICYSPLDKYRNCIKFFKKLNLDILVVVKHDIWPNMVKSASDLNIKTVLIDATLPSHSKRLNFFIKNFFGYIFSMFDYIFPISDDDYKRIKSISSNLKKVEIAGDTRFDQVVERALKAKSSRKVKLFSDKYNNIIILGSVWKSDTDKIFSGFKKILNTYPDTAGIIAPHEPETDYINLIQNELVKSNISYVKYTKKTDSTDKRIIIVDIVGVLAELYKYGDIAFIGGSFLPGVHNVMEPAIMGLPVLFGPMHKNSFEAIELNRKKGGFVVKTDGDFFNIVSKLISDKSFYKKSATIAENYVTSSIGATDKIYNTLKDIL